MSLRTLPTLLAAVAAVLAAAAQSAPRRDGELLPAIRASDYATVQQLLRQRAADPNRVLPDGATPLSWAAEIQDAQMVRLLLAAKAKPDAATNPAAAPLMLACEHGDAAVLELLLDAGADVQRVRTDGVAPLALCAGAAPAAIVARLLDTGARVEHADERGQTALMWAAARGRLDNVQLLLARGAAVNRETATGFTPLFFALKSGSPQVAAAIAAAGGSTTHVGPEATSAVQLAMYQQDYAFAARMVEAGADLEAFDRNGNTLLHAAVLAGQPALVQLLLARGADPNLPSAPPKVEWRYEPNFKTGDYKVPSKTPLLLAAEGGSAESMQLLLAAGADRNVKAADGSTILHAAVAAGHASAVAAALRANPDANVVDDNGRTPLHLLLQNRDNPSSEAGEIMRLLAASGARTDLKNKRGLTAADLLEKAAESTRTAYQAAFGIRTAGR
ncbi:MAG: ankyrin repeat domain-containing protein [Steroidobacteraceae bacterium]